MCRRMTIQQLAELVGGTFEGDGSVEITGVAGIAEAGPGQVSFIEGSKFAAAARESRATALIVDQQMETSFRPVIRTDSPRLAFIQVMRALLGDRPEATAGVHPTAVLGEGVQLGEGVSVQAHAYIEDNVTIGDGGIICPGCHIAENCTIGDRALIYANVTLGAGTMLGDNVIIHSGTNVGHTVGEDSDGSLRGSTVLESDVELGANCAVSRGTPQAPTVVGLGTKTDNLVQVGASVRTGRHCILVAQVTVGDGAVLGDNVTLAGQVNIAPGIEVGDGATVAARSLVCENVPARETHSGAPAREHSQERRIKAHVQQLPAIHERISRLERLVSQQAPDNNEK